MKTTCAVEECTRFAYTRGWCSMHYKRWWKHGDPLGTAEPRQRRRCSIEGCDLPAHAQALCGNHYARMRRGFDPSVTPIRRGPQSPRWVARERLDYDTLHERLKLQLGKAAIYQCIACGKQADEWAYQHTDPNPLVSAIGCLFTDDLDAYQPMCRSCHRLLDRQHRVLAERNGFKEVG